MSETNHKHCKYSSDLSGKLTAGQGKIDYWGYFERPCPECAKEMSQKIKINPNTNG